jgi:triosephosphate isomerase
MAAAEICQKTVIHIGAQDMSSDPNGAHTGDLSAEMLADAGATYVILGHSERRCDHGETDKMVLAKAMTASHASLTPIICVGETRAQRDAGQAQQVVATQLKGSVPADFGGGPLVVAYEPVWAIGTGLVPTPEDIARMHASIRQELNAHMGSQGAKVRILYGGSVKPDNAKDLSKIENVNGMLVGGASLKSADFLQILKAYG